MDGLRAGSVFGHYQLRRLVGQGGMGQVYEAYDTSKDRVVAIKILAAELSGDPTFRERFLRESRAAAKLQEPHVIPIHDWGEIDGRLYIDMRLVQGSTLQDLIASDPLDPARAVSIIGQIATALDAAHAQGLIHRDIKPQNIIVTPDDFAYLLDFGIAELQGASRLTVAGSQIGTLQYMAPERFGEDSATAAVDVYSLACVLYEALTGQPPFRPQAAQAVIAAHLNAPIPQASAANPAVPRALDAVIARGMAKEPDDRYGSAGALARAAARAVTPTQVSPTPPPPPPAAPPPAAPPPPTTAASSPNWQGRALVAIAATAVVLMAIAVTALVMRDKGSGPSASVPPSSVGLPSPTRAYPNSTGVSRPPAPKPAPAPAELPLGAMPPPLIEGPDLSRNRQICDLGFSMNNYTGPGSHAGRGTPETSCFFAQKVLEAYWTQYGRPTRQPRTVYARGAVDCPTVPGAECNGLEFVMNCAVYSGDDWVTCTGGNNARVYIY